jgi:putative salt-induced outer membrane protein YdiY
MQRRRFSPAALILAGTLPATAAAQMPPQVPIKGDPLEQTQISEQEGDLPKWEAEAELGLTTARGNTNSDTTTGRVAGDRTGRTFSLHLLGEGRYVEESNEAVTERYHGLIQLDGAFSRDIYGFALVDGLGDRFAGFYWRYTEAAGLGHKYFSRRDDLDLRVEAGPALRQERRTTGERNDMTGGRLRTAFRWEFMENSTIRQDLVYTQAFEESEEYYISSNTALTIHVNNHLAFKTSVQVEHNNQAYPGIKPTDTWTTTSLLYTY